MHFPKLCTSWFFHVICSRLSGKAVSTPCIVHATMSDFFAELNSVGFIRIGAWYLTYRDGRYCCTAEHCRHTTQHAVVIWRLRAYVCTYWLTTPGEGSASKGPCASQPVAPVDRCLEENTQFGFSSSPTYVQRVEVCVRKAAERS